MEYAGSFIRCDHVQSYLESLPRQTASVEVHEDIAQGFHVVSPTLLNAQVSIDAGIARRAG